MLFVKVQGEYRETVLQVGDRIRIRPGRGQFRLLRRAVQSIEVMGLVIPIRLRAYDDLVFLSGPDRYTHWLNIPLADNSGRDALARIVEHYRACLPNLNELHWVAEPRHALLDDRHDCVAVGIRAF
jgi:hypothetical protein